MPEPQAMCFFELIMKAAQVASAIGGQIGTGIFALLAIAKKRAEHASHPLVPGKLHEGFRLRHADQFGGLRTIAQIFAAPIEEEVDRRAIDKLETAIRYVLPVIGWDALT